MDYKKRKRISMAIAMGGLIPFIVFLTIVLLQPKHRRGALPIDNYLGIGFGLGVGLALLGVAVLWSWEFQTRITRRKKMRALAVQLGLSYTREIPIPPELLKGFGLFNKFGRVYQNLSNVLRGVVNGLEVFIFDYRHSDSMSGGGSMRGATWTFIDTFILIRHGKDEPQMLTFEKGLEIERIKPELNTALDKF